MAKKKRQRENKKESNRKKRGPRRRQWVKRILPITQEDHQVPMQHQAAKKTKQRMERCKPKKELTTDMKRMKRERLEEEQGEE